MKAGEIQAYTGICIRDTARSFRKLGEAWQDADNEELGSVMKQQLFATASVLENITEGKLKNLELSRGHRRDILRALLQKGVKVMNIDAYENHRGQYYLWLRAKQLRGACITAKEVAGIISRYYEGELMSAEGNRSIIGRQYEDYVFVQAPRYRLIIGKAGCPKSNNKVSGDSLSVSRLDCARTVIGLWDGMGNGRQAHMASGQAVEIMEYLLEAGFDEENAIALINATYSAKGRFDNTIAVDISVIDGYLGTLSCLKMGAVSTFIKRDGMIEVIKSTTLPIGIMPYVDCDSTVKKLYDGDFIIMVSDGILENLVREDKEMALVHIIAGIDSNNAGEIAQKILEAALSQCDGIAKDDMTVVAAGVFDTDIKVY